MTEEIKDILLQNLIQALKLHFKELTDAYFLGSEESRAAAQYNFDDCHTAIKWVNSQKIISPEK